MPPAAEQPSPDPVVALRWRTGAIGCLIPLAAIVMLLFGIAAFRPSLAEDMADGRGGGWIDATAGLTVGGVHLPLALLSLYVAWEFVRLCWRLADETAVTATATGLVPHGSTLLKPMPWSDICDVSFAPVGRAPALVIRLRDGRQRAIRGVDNDGGAAEAFAAAARARVRSPIVS